VQTEADHDCDRLAAKLQPQHCATQLRTSRRKKAVSQQDVNYKM